MRKIRCVQCGHINTFGKEVPQAAKTGTTARFRANGVVYLVSEAKEVEFRAKYPDAERL